jgi:hypothetical protein
VSVAHASAAIDTKLCKAIQRHLMTHPHAADTAAGILSAWLPPHGFEDAADHLDEALEALIAEGWLQAHTLPDGNVLYVAIPEKCSTLPPTS